MNLLIFCIHTSLQSFSAAGHTWKTFFKRFAWSMYWLWIGKLPTKDWDNNDIHSMEAGTDLMGGFFMALWAIIGDLDYFFKSLEQANANSSMPCNKCPCNSSTMPWWDFSINSLWIRSCYTIEQHIAAGCAKCALLEVFAVIVHSLCPDWMHCKH